MHGENGAPIPDVLQRAEEESNTDSEQFYGMKKMVELLVLVLRM